ncbi:DUF4129 domain-containing protein [Streptomyces daliensis]|uniref:DUF4129 domain-containing protein n=1 Tax=Streptomyces daliensis TaxID=299421 RepID=A0A8T4IMI9_9ACTN|nr:DUF4129 domain-containing protein [Streptomyces daliensis]
MTGGLATAALLPVLTRQPSSSAADDGGPPVTVPRVPAREAAERELSKARYHENDPSLLQQLFDWVWERVNNLLSAAAGATPGGWVGLAVLVLVLVLLVVVLRLRLGTFRPTSSSQDSALFRDGPRSAADHRAAAEAHASAARWSEALQERMRAIVRSLEERALLDPGPGRTADEAATEAGRELPDHAPALRSAAHDFDEVTYAGRPADAPAYTRMRDLDTALQRAKPRLAGAGAGAGAGTEAHVLATNGEGFGPASAHGGGR